MRRYEILILAVPTITQDEIKKIESDVDSTIKKGGNIISFEKWGKYRLAYPVKKNSYGVYALVRFTLDAEHDAAILKDLDSLLAVKFEAIVMRHILSVLDPNGSLVYVRPQSLEEEPERKSDDELSKGKIEKILSKTDFKKNTPKRDTTREFAEGRQMQNEESEVVEKGK